MAGCPTRRLQRSPGHATAIRPGPSRDRAALPAGGAQRGAVRSAIRPGCCQTAAPLASGSFPVMSRKYRLGSVAQLVKITLTGHSRDARARLQVAGITSDLDWRGRMVGEFRGLTLGLQTVEVALRPDGI
jgi:hypothetical protein